MATTLSYGFQKPATGDKGSVFWPILESDIQKLNDHTHNGSNSSKLTAVASTAIVQSVSSASWVAQGDGTYRQTITLPASLTSSGGTYDDYNIQIRNAAASKDILFLTVSKATSTTFYIDINDNSLDLKVVYT